MINHKESTAPAAKKAGFAHFFDGSQGAQRAHSPADLVGVDALQHAQAVPPEQRLTVFTPAFNRAHLLPRLYESLRNQTCRDFVWLIIDDGSSDGTQALVESWQAEGLLDIRYHEKPNGGMHTAHNAAYERIDTELNVCIDSDDWMPLDAVEKILACWAVRGSDRVSGIMGLDATADGAVIGTRLPEDRNAMRLDAFYAAGGRGDKKLVYRTEIMRRYPAYPVFEGEKYVSLGYKYALADREFPLLILNEVLCIVEYQTDGSSCNMFQQYRRNPKGFAFIRKMDMTDAYSRKVRCKAAIHYVAMSLFLRNGRFLQESPRPFLTFLALPAGVLLFLYLHWTASASPFQRPGSCA